MMNRCYAPKSRLYILFSLMLCLFHGDEAFCRSQSEVEMKLSITPSPKTELNLKDIGFKIVYETFRKSNDKENWELYLINADGSNPVNLTKTPDVDEMYPHASPDGEKVCFVADEMVKGEKIRNVYYMNIDGTALTEKLLRTCRANSIATPSKIMPRRGFSFMTFKRANTENIPTKICIIFIIFAGLPTASGFLLPCTEEWISNMLYWHSRPMERIFMI